MKFRYLLAIVLLFALIGFVSAEAFMPEEGTFAFREVENYTLHDINFTVPTEYRLQDSGNDFLDFKHGKDKLKITVVKDGKIEKVKSTKKIKSGNTMLVSCNHQIKGHVIDDWGHGQGLIYIKYI